MFSVIECQRVIWVGDDPFFEAPIGNLDFAALATAGSASPSPVATPATAAPLRRSRLENIGPRLPGPLVAAASIPFTS